MTAKEAREKALWNLLPYKIKVQISNTIDIGHLECVIYKSLDKDLFNTFYPRNTLILKELGYKVNEEDLNFDSGESDRKITIKW